MAARDCINRIQQVAGRKLTDEEVEAVFARIHQAALDIKAGRKAPSDINMGRKLEREIAGRPGADDARTLIQMAAERAAAELEAEAARAERNAYLQVVKMGARMADMQKARANGLDPLAAVQATITRDYSGRTNLPSLEVHIMGQAAYYGSKLLPVWDALGSDYLGFFQDRNKLIYLIRELRGEDTLASARTPEERQMAQLARRGAEEYHKVAEEARQAFNRAGGNIGKLMDWGMPQHHSQERVAAAGGFGNDPRMAQAKWVEDVLPLIDRARYTDDYGNVRSEAWLREFLAKAWETIATDGLNKLEPGKFTGGGGVANRHAEHREIHFKDADSVLKYWEEYGDRTAVQILEGHVETLARDIAMVELFGPNPDMTYRTMRDTALKDAAMGAPVTTKKLQDQTVDLDNLWQYATHGNKPSVNRTFSATMDGLANLNVGGKLGGAVWASVFGDKVMMEAASHLNHLPLLQRWMREISLLNPFNVADRRLLQQQGLMLDSIRSNLSRFYDGLGYATVTPANVAGQFASTTGKFAGAIMRVSGMQAINDIRKGAFGSMLYSQLGSMIERGVRFQDLGTEGVRFLKNYGINEHDWKVWSLAPLQDMGHGNRGVTPESVARITDRQMIQANVVAQAASPEEIAAVRRDAIVKLIGAVNTESEFAIVTPGLKERAVFHGTSQRGTLGGELWRSWWQFKSFPWTQFQRSMDLIRNAPTPASKAVMVSYLLFATTLAGAMIMQVREMLSGKDPRPMWPDKPYDRFKFWGAAFLQGGALGIYGDFLSSVNQTRYGTGPLEIMAGPTIGPMLSLMLTQPMNAAAKSLDGKETHLGAQSIAQLKGFVPGNNLWYTKAVTEHLFWQRVMENLSPGYLSNMRSKTLKDYGQDWWWGPGENLPDRGPSFENMLAR